MERGLYIYMRYTRERERRIEREGKKVEEKGHISGFFLLMKAVTIVLPNKVRFLITNS